MRARRSRGRARGPPGRLAARGIVYMCWAQSFAVQVVVTVHGPAADAAADVGLSMSEFADPECKPERQFPVHTAILVVQTQQCYM